MILDTSRLWLRDLTRLLIHMAYQRDQPFYDSG
jgi:hypothetical protein